MNSNETSEEREESENDDNDDNTISNDIESINDKIKNIGKDNDIFIISLALLKKFNEMHINDSDNNNINYIYEIGLPMNFKSIKNLSIYLYFHKICSSYYILFSKISDEKITDIIILL